MTVTYLQWHQSKTQRKLKGKKVNINPGEMQRLVLSRVTKIVDKILLIYKNVVFAILSQCIAIVVVVGKPPLQHVARSRYVGCRIIGGWIGFMLLQRRERYIRCQNVGGCIGFVLLHSRWGYVGCRNAAFNRWCCAVRVLPSWKKCHWVFHADTPGWFPGLPHNVYHSPRT